MVCINRNNNIIQKSRTETLRKEIVDLTDFTERMIYCFKNGNYDLGSGGADHLEGFLDYIDKKASSAHRAYICLQRGNSFEKVESLGDYEAIKVRIEVLREITKPIF